MTTARQFHESALTADQTHLLEACVVETDFASTARAHDNAVAKARTLWEAPVKDTCGNMMTRTDPDFEEAKEAHDALAYQQSTVADLIRRLMWAKWPEASAAWFNRASVSD
jgi:hypothetical protein